MARSLANSSVSNDMAATARYAGYGSIWLFGQGLVRAGRISAVSLLRAATTR